MGSEKRIQPLFQEFIEETLFLAKVSISFKILLWVDFTNLLKERWNSNYLLTW